MVICIYIFSLQPIDATLSHQLSLWHSLILSYLSHYNLHIIDLNLYDIHKQNNIITQLFRNEKIDSKYK